MSDFKADPPKPSRGRPRTFDTTQVTDLAMRAYWQAGPTEVSLNAICAQAGVSKPSLYRIFGNDDGLTHAALERYGQVVLSRMLEIVTSAEGFADKIRGIVHLVAEDTLHAEGCLFVKMRAARAQMGPRTQDLIAQMEAGTQEALSAVLTQARASGAWRADIPIALGAQYLQAQIGLALEYRARGEDPKAILELALSALGARDV